MGLEYNRLTISLSIVIERLKIVKDRDLQETNQNKLILPRKLKNLLLMLAKDYWILMILVCILQLHNKEVLVKNKNKKSLINFKNCKGFRSSINKNLWETLNNYKRKVFKQIKLLIQWQKRKPWLHQVLHNEKVRIFPWEAIVKM